MAAQPWCLRERFRPGRRSHHGGGNLSRCSQGPVSGRPGEGRPGLLCSFLHKCPAPFPLGDLELDALHSFIALLPFFVFHVLLPPGAQKPHLLLWWPGCGHRGQACPCRLWAHADPCTTNWKRQAPRATTRPVLRVGCWYYQFAFWPDCEFVGGECILVHSFCISGSLGRLQNSSYTEGHPGLPPAACLALPEQSG